MNMKNSFLKIKKQSYRLLTNPKVVKYCIIGAIIIFVSSLIIGYIVANIDGNSYNIFENYISDLGSSTYTTIPFIFNNAVIITAILLIPVSFYLKKLFNVVPEGYEESERELKLRKITSNLILIFTLIAMVGFFGIGFFSKDVGDTLQAIYGPVIPPNGTWHDVFVPIIFGFLPTTGILIGIVFIIHHKIIPDKFKVNIPLSITIVLGIEMLIMPLPVIIFYLLTHSPFWEWMGLFYILGWIIPLGLMTIKQINQETIY